MFIIIIKWLSRAKSVYCKGDFDINSLCAAKHNHPVIIPLADYFSRVSSALCTFWLHDDGMEGGFLTLG